MRRSVSAFLRVPRGWSASRKQRNTRARFSENGDTSACGRENKIEIPGQVSKETGSERGRSSYNQAG